MSWWTRIRRYIANEEPRVRDPIMREPTHIMMSSDLAGRWYDCSRHAHHKCPCDPKWRVAVCTCECHKNGHYPKYTGRTIR